MALMTVLLVAASGALPVALAVGISWLSRRAQDRDGRRSPIENRTVHGAAEQLRKRVEEHGDELMVSIGILLFVGPYFLAIWALQRVDLVRVKFGFGDYLLLATAAAVAGLLIQRVLRHGKKRRIANEGLKAELYTAQELNRLMALGCTVLHDIPCDQFNIDHVVVGPRGIYAVETKSVRKPAPTGGRDHFKVNYDGQRLHFPGFSDDKRLQQTKRQAEWLAGYLERVVGRKVPVIPALALPGWWIDSTGGRTSLDVRVFNPAGRGAEFMAESKGGSIDPSAVPLITQALVMRYAATTDRK